MVLQLTIIQRWYNSRDYIGWSSFHDPSFVNKLQHGLLGGLSPQDKMNNIFVLSKYVYKCNSGYFKDRLPPIKSEDIVKLEYDSNNNVLSYSSIINLPKDKTFYWMVGHSHGQMSMTIVDT